MRKPFIWLGAVLGLGVLVYGWVLFRPGPPVEVGVMITPDGPVFRFNGRVELYELKVLVDGVDEADDADALRWHLVPRDVEDVEPRRVQAVAYGEPRGLGLRPAKGTRGRGKPLEPGVTYRFVADTGAGDAVATFALPSGQ